MASGGKAYKRPALGVVTGPESRLLLLDNDTLEKIAVHCGWSLGALRSCARFTSMLKGKARVLRVVLRIMDHKKLKGGTRYGDQSHDRELVAESNNARLLRCVFGAPWAPNNLQDAVCLTVDVSSELRDRKARAQKKMSAILQGVDDIREVYESLERNSDDDHIAAGNTSHEASNTHYHAHRIMEKCHNRLARRMLGIIKMLAMFCVASHDADEVQYGCDSVGPTTRILLLSSCFLEIERICIDNPSFRFDPNDAIALITAEMADPAANRGATHSLLSYAVAFGHHRVVSYLVKDKKLSPDALVPTAGGRLKTCLQIGVQLHEQDLKIVATFASTTPVTAYEQRVCERCNNRGRIEQILREHSRAP